MDPNHSTNKVQEAFLVDKISNQSILKIILYLIKQNDLQR